MRNPAPCLLLLVLSPPSLSSQVIDSLETDIQSLHLQHLLPVQARSHHSHQGSRSRSSPKSRNLANHHYEVSPQLRFFPRNRSQPSLQSLMRGSRRSKAKLPKFRKPFGGQSPNRTRPSTSHQVLRPQKRPNHQMLHHQVSVPPLLVWKVSTRSLTFSSRQR